MCGRFVSSSPPEEIARYFAADVVETALTENFNVAPTSDIYVVYEDDAHRHLDAFHWGLVPGFAKDLEIGHRMINARAETVASKGVFASSFAKRRCIVPADGFYEWAKVPGAAAKQPYFVYRADGRMLALGGLWSEWHGEVGGESMTVRSTTIITTAANDTMAPIHDRMPLILAPDDWDRWLSPEVREPDAVSDLLVAAPDDVVIVHPVSRDVNKVANSGAHLVDPVDPPSQTPSML